MYSSRIKESANLLRSFGLQAIISSPSEKLAELVSYVDLILVANHNDRRKHSSVDVYEEKKKKAIVEEFVEQKISEQK